ncbi:MAG: hypothetical protein ABFE07_07010, partial [Armatimonadia bacterium]
VALPFLLGIAFQVARHYAGLIGDQRVRALLLSLVAGAEQIYGGGEGATKLAHVEHQAEQLGLCVNRTDIEAAVYTLKSTQPQAAIAAAPAGAPSGGQ